MSEKPSPKRRSRRNSGSAGKRGQHDSAKADYEVGYGKPPVSTRFVKGQSGNPAGRPRKPKPRAPKLSDALSDRFLEEEAYRPVRLRENGQPIELPTTQAVVRSLATKAINGSRLSQKLFMEWVKDAEEEQLQWKIERYVRLQELKREGEKTLAYHERKSLPPPDLLPHPEDIVLDPVNGEAYVHGPADPEDLHFYEHTVQLRDYLLLRAAHNDRNWKRQKGEDGEASICANLLFAQVLNRMLPRRFRWQDDAEIGLIMEYRSMTRRERERRIEAELAHLRETEPRTRYHTPEIKHEIDKLIQQWVKQKQREA